MATQIKISKAFRKKWKLIARRGAEWKTHVQRWGKIELGHRRDTGRISEAQFWGHRQGGNGDRSLEIWGSWRRESVRIWRRSHRVKRERADLRVALGWRKCREEEWKRGRGRWRWASTLLPTTLPHLSLLRVNLRLSQGPLLLRYLSQITFLSPLINQNYHFPHFNGLGPLQPNSASTPITFFLHSHIRKTLRSENGNHPPALYTCWNWENHLFRF